MKSKNIQNNEKKKLNLIDLLSLKNKDIKKILSYSHGIKKVKM